MNTVHNVHLNTFRCGNRKEEKIRKDFISKVDFYIVPNNSLLGSFIFENTLRAKGLSETYYKVGLI